jgi:hypothetical protein
MPPGQPHRHQQVGMAATHNSGFLEADAMRLLAHRGSARDDPMVQSRLVPMHKRC